MPWGLCEVMVSFHRQLAASHFAICRKISLKHKVTKASHQATAGVALTKLA